jgi:hypothetical protein
MDATAPSPASVALVCCTAARPLLTVLLKVGAGEPGCCVVCEDAGPAHVLLTVGAGRLAVCWCVKGSPASVHVLLTVGAGRWAARGDV